jgi:hypothetical protein
MILLNLLNFTVIFSEVKNRLGALLATVSKGFVSDIFIMVPVPCAEYHHHYHTCNQIHQIHQIFYFQNFKLAVTISQSGKIVF